MLKLSSICWPLNTSKRIWPDEPGQFGAKRKHDIHTGIDLYCEPETRVLAVQDGYVVGIEAFTGAHVPAPDESPWWNNTWALVVQDEHNDKLWVYGEISKPEFMLGQRVEAGQELGTVIPVLKKDKGRPRHMLHIERHLCQHPLYTGFYTHKDHVSTTYWWKHNEPKPNRLLDPTPVLKPLANKQFNLNEYQNDSSL